MRVTALEIRQQQFPVRFRGLDPGEVDKFLELVAGDMEDLVRENARLREALGKKDQELERTRQGEEAIKRALMTIEEIREEWVGRAEKQAEEVVRESTLKAHQLTSEAERRLEALQRDVQALGRQKHELISSMRHLLEEYLNALESFEHTNGDAIDCPSAPSETSEPLEGPGGPDRA